MFSIMMYAVAEDLELTLTELLRTVAPERLVVIEEAPDYPGELVFQVVEGAEQSFYSRYRDWVSRYLVLSELFNLPTFITQLCQDGWEPVFGPSAEPILSKMAGWMEPLEVEGYDLHPFQQFSLRRAFERDLWFWNWATGAGKSFCAAVGAKKLFTDEKIDVVIACTIGDLTKGDLCRFFTKAGLDTVVNDGTKAKRRKVYQQCHQGYVMNYEKLSFDHDDILDLIHGLRVLWVFDECHKIISDTTNGAKYNNARRSFAKLLPMTLPGTKIWPMSASVVNGNPLRFRDVFSLDGGNNPLGSKGDFERRYADSVKTVPLKLRNGRTFSLAVYDWNLSRLQEVRHRVGDRTQAVRKTDPGLRELFKGLQTILEPVRASREEWELFDIIVDRAWEQWRHDPQVNLNPYYSLLRTAANTPLALLRTEHDEGKQIAHDHAELIAKAHSSKVAKLNEQLECIREGGDKALVFTHWTNLGLHLIKDQITVPHVVHYGQGLSATEAMAAQERFKSDPDITCFLTSDAGAHGLNMQVARYVIQLEPTYSYDLGMQRASRIDRADSHLDGLTNYVYCIEGSVEERVWAANNGRRLLSAAVQGTAEVQSYEAMTGRPWTPQEAERARQSEALSTPWLIFGDRL